MRSNSFKSLENPLANFTKGLPIAKWAEVITHNLIIDADQKSLPVTFSGKILKLRRIEKISWFEGNLPERGRLKIGKKGFIIEATNQYYSLWGRLIVAHEIAHTFFYDISTWPPNNLFILEVGNNDMESLCDYMARALLLPEFFLKKTLKQKNKFYPAFSPLRVLEDLVQVSQTPWQILAQRLIHDLKLWNYVILQFVLLPDKKLGPDNEKRWFLKNHFSPADNKIFIPWGRYLNGARKMPCAKGLLEDLLKDCYKLGEKNTHLEKRVDIKYLQSNITAGLMKYISNFSKNNEIDVSFLVYNERNIFNQTRRTHYILMCIPLETRKLIQK